MKTYLAVVLGIVLAGSMMSVKAEDDAAAKPAAPAEKAAAVQAVYVCPHCDTMAMQAGKCSKCGMDMQQAHMLGMKDGKVMMCGCEAGCKCDAAGMKDGKCGCGKDVRMMSAKGMYACACAGGKCCSTISDKAGKCACGHDLKKME